MPLRIEIPDDDVKHLNGPARDQLISSVTAYVDEVLTEAGRLEAGINTTGRNPEIVSSMISDAVLLLERGYKTPRVSNWTKFFQIISVVSSALFGIMFDYEKITQPLFLVAVLVVFAIAVASTIVVIMKG
jgi:hypothetical protein